MAAGIGTKPEGAVRAPATFEEDKGHGWILFAGIMVLVAAVLNIIYGIAAIDDSKFMINDATYVFSDLHTWGWILVVMGVLEGFAAFSIWRGGAYGRWFGIFAAALSLFGALLAIQAYPFWALTIVAIDVLVIYGLAVYGGLRRFT
jgi:hypothetical protein